MPSPQTRVCFGVYPHPGSRMPTKSRQRPTMLLRSTPSKESTITLRNTHPDAAKAAPVQSRQRPVRARRALLALQACSNSDDVITTAAQDTACAQVTDSGRPTWARGFRAIRRLPNRPPASGPRNWFQPRPMVVTANPYASKAGCEALKKGGSAVDAAVAVQAVLGLWSPSPQGWAVARSCCITTPRPRKSSPMTDAKWAPAAATEDYLRTISATNAAPPLPIPGRNRTRIPTPHSRR